MTSPDPPGRPVNKSGLFLLAWVKSARPHSQPYRVGNRQCNYRHRGPRVGQCRMREVVLPRPIPLQLHKYCSELQTAKPDFVVVDSIDVIVLEFVGIVGVVPTKC